MGAPSLLHSSGARQGVCVCSLVVSSMRAEGSSAGLMHSTTGFLLLWVGGRKGGWGSNGNVCVQACAMRVMEAGWRTG